MRVWAIGALAMMLAACEAQSPPAEAPIETPVPVEADGGIGDGADPIDVAAAIPERFHGVWDDVEGTCSPDSHLRLEVTAMGFASFTSSGTVITVDTGELGEPIASFAVKAEDMTWQSQWAFFVEEAEPHGELLVLTPYQDGAPVPTEVPTFGRKRCPS